MTIFLGVATMQLSNVLAAALIAVSVGEKIDGSCVADESCQSDHSLLQVRSQSVAQTLGQQQHLHKVLARHLEGTPFQPGVADRASLGLFSEVKLDPPDFVTVDAASPRPWESGEEPLVRCPSSADEAPKSTGSKADADLQKATKIFCDAGLDQIVEFYVDPKFQANYKRLVGADGWIPQAYLTYFGLKKQHDNTAAEEDLLIQSVHHFSENPIVCANFGNRTPAHMTPERFPNLVLFHARQSATDLGKGFNLNKLVTMTFTKVKGGLVLDGDQFLNRGMDVMFQRAFEETTEEYPYPIMPVHWMSRDPESDDMAAYPASYAFHWKNPAGPNRSMRWGHAHPTWTHHSLPWLAKWVSYNLAPEKTDSPQWLKDQGFVSDEPLLNFASWHDGLTKQWCKYDLTQVGLFSQYLKQESMTKINRDKKWFPNGIAFIFFSAHDAKDPDESYEFLSKLWETGDDKRKAILFDGKWFGSGKALREYDPSLKCIA